MPVKCDKAEIDLIARGQLFIDDLAGSCKQVSGTECSVNIINDRAKHK